MNALLGCAAPQVQASHRNGPENQCFSSLASLFPAPDENILSNQNSVWSGKHNRRRRRKPTIQAGHPDQRHFIIV
jgi:hypothetical protein